MHWCQATSPTTLKRRRRHILSVKQSNPMRSHPRIKVEFIFTCGRDSDIFVHYNWASHEVFKPLSNHHFITMTQLQFCLIWAVISRQTLLRGAPLSLLRRLTNTEFIHHQVLPLSKQMSFSGGYSVTHEVIQCTYWMKWYDGLMGQFLQVIKLKSKNIQGDSGSLLPLD